MNRAIWRKAFSDSWPQLVVTSALLVLFGWLFVWLTSLFKLGLWANFVGMLPDFVHRILGVPLSDLATPTGRLSLLYTHVITLLLFLGWSIGRASDVVSGGIASGNLELILTLPVRRVTVLVVPAIVTSLGAVVLAIAIWLGNWIGLMTVELDGEASIWQFVPGAVNLFAMAFCLAGLTTFFSSWDHNRWRTIWLAGGFFIVSEVIEMVARLWQSAAWLRYFSFLAAFEPHRLILMHSEVWSASLWYNVPLLVLGMLAYGAATIVFCWRDIPVPR